MARPPVDSRLQNIEKMQKNMEQKIDKMLNGIENPTSNNEKNEDTLQMDCECEDVTVEPESSNKKQNNNGESNGK